MPTRRILRGLALAVLVMFGNWAAPPAFAQGDLEAQEESAMRAAVEKVASSVVRIEAFGGLEAVGGALVGTGPTSGVIVSEDGYVLSSAFNFVQKPTSILVRLPSGKRVAAEIVGRDNSRMLVLLKVNTDEKLPVPASVPRAEMQVGQWTIAIGRAFDQDQANISVGVLSARNRVWGKAIQTDAKISPSNYGGALVDIQGRVLGVLVPLSPQGQGELAGAEWYDSGIGFAVPLAEIMPYLDRLKKGEELHPGVLGVSLKGSDIYASPADLAAVQPKSPAYKGGLKAGDRIVEVDGEKIVRQAQLKHAIGRLYAGDKVKLVVTRGEQRIEATVELTDKLEPYQHPFVGVLPMRTTAAGDKPGVTIRHVYPASPAETAGLKAGDRLTAIADKPIENLAAALERLANHEPGEKLAVKFDRGGTEQSAEITLAALPTDIPGELPPARGPAGEAAGERPPVGIVEIKLPEEQNECFALVPDNCRPNVPCGVLVYLPAPGALDRDKLAAAWKSDCEKSDVILLVPLPAEASRWQPTEVDFIRKTIDDVKSKYTVDPRRVVVLGSEAGGAMAFLTAFAHRDLIRGVIARESALPLRAQLPANDPIDRLAIFLVYNKSAKATAARIEANVKQLTEAKFPVTVQAADETVKDISDAQRGELLRWLDALDRI